MELLAKSRSAELPNGVPLATHLLEVVRAMESIERRHPSLPAISGVPNLFRVLRTAALLHDVGKAHPEFQAMLNGGARFEFRHEVFSVAFRWDDPQLEDGDWQMVHLAVLTHHKDIDVINKRYDKTDTDQTALRLPTEFLRDGQDLLNSGLLKAAHLDGATLARAAPARAEAALRIQQALAASIRHAKRERPYNDAITLAGRFLRGALIMSDHSSSAGKEFIFLRPDEVRPKVATPYPHQTQAAATIGNAILTAPTGSGKTEAALLWAAAQSREGDAPLLFYVLPYQASMNAMRERLARTIREEALALQHGKAAQALYLRLLSRNYSAQESRMLTASEKAMGRLHTAAIRILSPYQLLRAAYSLPGHECLSMVPADSLFVFDEIHAYEAGRLSMILAMMRHFANDLRSRMFVMTATMPSRLRQIVGELLPDVSLVRAPEEVFQACKRHSLRLRSEELMSEQIRTEILFQAEDGRAVLVVANTVSRAQDLASDLAARTGVQIELLHSRFHMEDRIAKERVLDRDHGVGKGRNSEGAILVATQVVEVSLNIDFDILYTDPAPIEALLQRFGRVNRTPGGNRRLKPVHVCGRLDSALPYSEEEVDRSVEAIKIWDNGPINEAEVQTVIDGVYEGAFGERWEAEVRGGMLNFQESALDLLQPFRSNPELERQFDDLFEGYEVIPASLKPEFDSRASEEPLLAQLLTVPISKRQFGRLYGKGLLKKDKESNYWVAEVAYGSRGLKL